LLIKQQEERILEVEKATEVEVEARVHHCHYHY
jgi:hypothetical protein